MLYNRFKKSIYIIINLLIKKKYIIRDAVNRREPREYVQKMFRLVKNIDLIFLKNQLNFIFNKIDLKVQASNIRRFKNDIIFNNFLIDINNVKHD